MFVASESHMKEVSMLVQASPIRAPQRMRGIVLQASIALLLAVAVIAATVPRLVRAVPPETLDGLTFPTAFFDRVP